MVKLHKKQGWQLVAVPTGQTYGPHYLQLHKLQLHKIDEGFNSEGYSLDSIKIMSNSEAEPVVGDWSTGRWLIGDLRKLRIVG